MPLLEAGFRGVLELLQTLEVEVVGRKPPGEFPDSLDGRELRAVRWEEKQFEAVPVPTQIRPEQLGVVVAGVVQDDDHFHAPRPPAERNLEEVQEGFRVEHGGEAVDELPRPQADSAEAGGRAGSLFADRKPDLRIFA